jgi:hypothetical protein
MNLNYDVEKYSLDELIEIFNIKLPLKDTLIDNLNLLTENVRKIKLSIEKKQSVTENEKIKIYTFLHKAKERLITHLYNELSPIKSTNTTNTPINTYPTDFHDGTINPLKIRIVKQILNVDTKFRDNFYITTSTNFSINLPAPIMNVVKMEFLSMNLPATIYSISSEYNNNFFRLNVNDVDKTFNLPNGVYDNETIMTAIKEILKSEGHPFDYVSFSNSDSLGTGQTIVAPNGTGVVTKIELDFQSNKDGIYDETIPLMLKFGWILGFRNGYYVNGLNYVSEGLLKMLNGTYFYLSLDDFNNANDFVYGAFNSSILNKNIITRISINGSQTSNDANKLLSLNSIPREYFGPVNIKTIKVQLLDEYGRIVDLNNMDYSFCIRLTTLYDL